MIIRKLLIAISFFTIGSCNSCKKDIAVINRMPETLTYYQWHLSSITNSDPSIKPYYGVISDSLRFTWKFAYNGNFLLDSIFYYLNGTISKHGASYTRSYPTDTITCFPNWKIGYSNLIQIKYISDNLLVLKISDTANTKMETDSLTHN